MNETPARSDQRIYRLGLACQLDEEFVSAYCPAGTERRNEDETTLLENIETDQSGIIGLIRTLHNLGCTILFLATSVPAESAPADASGEQP